MSRSSWRTAQLGELAHLRKGVSYQGAHLDRPGPRLLGLGTVVPGGGINLDKARTYGGPIKDWQRIRPGEVFIALTDITQEGRLLGSPALLPSRAQGDFAVTHHVARVEISEPELLDTRFLYYLLQAPEARDYMRGVATGTTVRAVSVADAEALTADFPPLIEQRAIAHILGTLDDKIEVNRGINETLEAMARAIFKSWFVDFDPVRAKAEGRKPAGMDAATAALFPDRFEDSELGRVPAGWGIQPVSGVAQVIRGRSYSSAELAPSSTALVTLKSVARGGGYRPDGLKPFTGSYGAEQEVAPGEVVIACTDVTQAAEVIGRPAMVRKDSRYNTLVASLDLVVVRPLPAGLSVPFLYLLFGTDDFHAQAYEHTSGTTVLHLDRNAIPSYKLVMPDLQVLRAFNQIVRPLFSLVENNEQHSSILAAIRDTLLPKLLSGQVSVRDMASGTCDAIQDGHNVR